MIYVQSLVYRLKGFLQENYFFLCTYKNKRWICLIPGSSRIFSIYLLFIVCSILKEIRIELEIIGLYKMYQWAFKGALYDFMILTFFSRNFWVADSYMNLLVDESRFIKSFFTYLFTKKCLFRANHSYFLSLLNHITMFQIKYITSFIFL